MRENEIASFCDGKPEPSMFFVVIRRKHNFVPVFLLLEETGILLCTQLASKLYQVDGVSTQDTNEVSQATVRKEIDSQIQHDAVRDTLQRPSRFNPKLVHFWNPFQSIVEKRFVEMAEKPERFIDS
jgi:hypothetical protein